MTGRTVDSVENKWLDPGWGHEAALVRDAGHGHRGRRGRRRPLSSPADLVCCRLGCHPQDRGLRLTRDEDEDDNDEDDDFNVSSTRARKTAKATPAPLKVKLSRKVTAGQGLTTVGEGVLALSR